MKGENDCVADLHWSSDTDKDYACKAGECKFTISPFQVIIVCLPFY